MRFLMKKTITREYLANCIKEELGLSRSDSLKLISITLKNLSNSLKKDKVLKLTDKSSPEDIKKQLNMSKKAFKKAIGFLYKRKVILLQKDRVELLN